MQNRMVVPNRVELQTLLELTQRVGAEPLLTQGSTGNSSIKIDGILWIKASGKWMADATCDDILIPLNLMEIKTCLKRGVDPFERYPGASIETAMHATLPHRVVLHVHCVHTIAWAVRGDAPIQLHRLLRGLRWQWIPYIASGIPLARHIEKALSACPDLNLFVLGNHGLILCGQDPQDVEDLLTEVRSRVSIANRYARPPNYSALADLSKDSCWKLPHDDEVHCLGTDNSVQRILIGGLLYPCQAIFSDCASTEPFHPISFRQFKSDWQNRYANRRFLVIAELGVLVNKSIMPGELAMISGLTRVLQRIDSTAPLRYLTRAEVAEISSQAMCRYRKHANQQRRGPDLKARSDRDVISVLSSESGKDHIPEDEVKQCEFRQSTKTRA